MKIDIKEVPNPRSRSFRLFAKLNVMDIIKGKVIRLYADHETKTRITTSISCGEATFKINRAHPDFNTVQKDEYNYFSQELNISHYFVISKKQGRTEYLSYIHTVVKGLFTEIGIAPRLDELTIEFIDNIEWP